MTALRRRMTEELTLRGYARNTIKACGRAVAQLAAFYKRSPELLGEDEVRHYLVQLATIRQVSYSTQKIALCCIKFFYERTLGREWNVFGVARLRRVRKLPVVQIGDEVWRALHAVRIPTYRACLTTIYCCAPAHGGRPPPRLTSMAAARPSRSSASGPARQELLLRYESWQAPEAPGQSLVDQHQHGSSAPDQLLLFLHLGSNLPQCFHHLLLDDTFRDPVLRPEIHLDGKLKSSDLSHERHQHASVQVSKLAHGDPGNAEAQALQLLVGAVLVVQVYGSLTAPARTVGGAAWATVTRVR
jgi:hypothetical protein